MLRLGSCFDLLDPYNLSYLERLYAKYKATADEAKLLLAAKLYLLMV